MNKEIKDNQHDHDHEHECGCGCGEEHLDEFETILLTLDDDSEMECIILGIFTIEDTDYIALITVDDEQVLLYRYLEDKDSPDDFALENIESDEEFEKVSAVFFEIFSVEDEVEE
ncbi:MAG: DUF1292 domain-containing protein [Tissierellia bacterium]|nr:DUF1292 domain-containing protein [Tissierellia bacterium]